MSELLLGIDSGLTVTKAVVFTPGGEPLDSGSVPSQQRHPPHEGWVEKDPDEQWAGAQQAIARAVEEAGVKGSDIAAIGTTGHGDGLYTLDDQGCASPSGRRTRRSRPAGPEP